MQSVEDHLQGRATVYECEHRICRKDGTWGWVLARGRVAERGDDGNPIRLVGTHVDVSARKDAEHRIAHMAQHDPLTDLPNRVLFRERLDRKLLEIGGNGSKLAVLCLDLDHFKEVNDTFGHLAGDALLQELSKRMLQLMSPGDTLARLGGDEFGVLLSLDPGREAVECLAQDLIRCVVEPVHVGDYQAGVGLSIGVAIAPEHGRDAETLFRRADLALYCAKAKGRNTWRFFETAMDEAAANAMKLDGDLRTAIARNEMRLHYQPQVDTVTGRIVGFEALMRWQHPERGLVPPNEFIPIAENNGLICQLGEWAIRSACYDAASWHPSLTVAVNLSPRQFQVNDLPERIQSILAETGLQPERLELEVTENVIINDLLRALATLQRLKNLGICITMDDFGTGYSSLATLQAFPFDKIKIDRSFVGQVETNQHAAVITRAVVGLGRSLGVQVIAEGVETAEQMDFLRREQCPEVQGYLVSRPMPIEFFAHLTTRIGDCEQRNSAFSPACVEPCKTA